ncbi:TetR/AcrR family transcriptional regulator [Streptomyces tagetis]|uniref:TetR/AcrR family transcriptional regulator C-terminal domain-containing protein n=1 Tax=Streptomyces tagetis TaxID=2820809 RepID=A0A941AWR5_9ACTN|nr:TetR/AcrR family transcriptional regulator C-terminal domain-containing protein [Streptomyces sp. RG38]MBQ0825099.1 TetR/AcrR family transcriptional regulator C-terminal domain-containing protein [Streptomyces sp. RG38]
MAERDPFRESRVESRRNRPAKPPLSRDAIVDEALRQISAEGGAEGGAPLSLRKIAKALDTGPASLYAYVDGMNELQALVLDHALGAVETAGDGFWRDRLEALLLSYATVLARSPALARMAFQTTAVGPHALRINDALLGLLAEAGVDQADAAWAIDLLSLFVTATVAEHAQDTGAAEPGGPIEQALARTSAGQYPRVHAARDDILSGTGEERFLWGIDILVRGILARSQSR